MAAQLQKTLHFFWQTEKSFLHRVQINALLEATNINPQDQKKEKNHSSANNLDSKSVASSYNKTKKDKREFSMI